VSEQTPQEAALHYVLSTVNSTSTAPLESSVAQACLINCGYDVDAAIEQLQNRCQQSKTRNKKWIPLSTFNNQLNERQKTPTAVRTGLSYANALRQNNIQLQEDHGAQRLAASSESNDFYNSAKEEVEMGGGGEVDANGSSLVVLANFPGERAICEHFRQVRAMGPVK